MSKTRALDTNSIDSTARAMVSRFDPFFFIFVVPGLTLVAVAWWPTTVAVRNGA